MIGVQQVIHQVVRIVLQKAVSRAYFQVAAQQSDEVQRLERALSQSPNHFLECPAEDEDRRHLTGRLPVYLICMSKGTPLTVVDDNELVVARVFDVKDVLLDSVELFGEVSLHQHVQQVLPDIAKGHSDGANDDIRLPEAIRSDGSAAVHARAVLLCALPFAVQFLKQITMIHSPRFYSPPAEFVRTSQNRCVKARTQSVPRVARMQGSSARHTTKALLQQKSITYLKDCSKILVEAFQIFDLRVGLLRC